MFDLSKCTNQELKDLKTIYKLQLNWSGENISKISKYGKIVALLEIDECMYENYLMIYAFEVLEKSKGIGAEIIKKLIHEDKEKLCLYPDNSKAAKFWTRMGFKEASEGNGVIVYFYPPLT